MSRRPKKRTKKYSGEDAKHLQQTPSEPVVHRYTAIERNPLGQWWFDNKRMTKILAVVVGIAALAMWMIYELVKLVF